MERDGNEVRRAGVLPRELGLDAARSMPSQDPLIGTPNRASDAAAVVRPIVEVDRAWAGQLLSGHFGDTRQARRGELIDAMTMSGLVAVDEHGERLGLLTFRDLAGEVEILALVAETRHHGVGTALLGALLDLKADSTIWVVTTNDNLNALRFYQRRGFRIRGVRPGAVDAARVNLKLSIPVAGEFGIAIRDEIELVRLPANGGACPS